MVKPLTRNEITSQAQKIHMQLFPEEYQFMNDSIADASDRKSGINPMSQTYLSKVNVRRQRFGLSALDIYGYTVEGESLELCRKIVSDGLNDLLAELIATLSDLDMDDSQSSEYMYPINSKADSDYMVVRDVDDALKITDMGRFSIEWYDSDPFNEVMVIDSDTDQVIAIGFVSGYDDRSIIRDEAKILSAIEKGECIPQVKNSDGTSLKMRK